MLLEYPALFYWQREVVQSITFRGANNCGTHGFVKKNFFHFLKINVLELKVGFFLMVSV